MDKDKKIDLLLSEIEKRKENIKSATESDWKTSCVLLNSMRNLRTIGKKEDLVKYFTEIHNEYKTYNEVNEALKISNNGEFKHNGFTYDEWLNDFILRKDQIERIENEKLISKLEVKLKKLYSEDKKKDNELNDIEDLLGKFNI